MTLDRLTLWLMGKTCCCSTYCGRVWACRCRHERMPMHWYVSALLQKPETCRSAGRLPSTAAPLPPSNTHTQTELVISCTSDTAYCTQPANTMHSNVLCQPPPPPSPHLKQRRMTARNSFASHRANWDPMQARIPKPQGLKKREGQQRNSSSSRVICITAAGGQLGQTWRKHTQRPRVYEG